MVADEGHQPLPTLVAHPPQLLVSHSLDPGPALGSGLVPRRQDVTAEQVVHVPAPRGRILDRNGVVLATNYKAYTLELTPSRLGRTTDEAIDAIAQVVEVTPRELQRTALPAMT